MADTGFSSGCRYLLRYLDAKFCATIDGLLEAVGIKVMNLPPRSPSFNLRDRWIRSVKTEVLSKMILFGERSLRQCLNIYVSHHTETNHQGKDNVILFPVPAARIGESSGEVRICERLGGLLKFS